MNEHLELVVGAELPTLTWTAGLDIWNRFAAVNDEFIPIHMDDAAGRAAGYEGAFGMGYLQWSWVHDVLREFIGETGRIEKVQGSFRAPTLKGAAVTAGGRVAAVTILDDRIVVDVDVWTQTSDGTAIFPGTGRVSFPAS